MANNRIFRDLFQRSKMLSVELNLLKYFLIIFKHLSVFHMWKQEQTKRNLSPLGHSSHLFKVKPPCPVSKTPTISFFPSLHGNNSSSSSPKKLKKPPHPQTENWYQMINKIRTKNVWLTTFYASSWNHYKSSYNILAVFSKKLLCIGEGAYAPCDMTSATVSKLLIEYLRK